MKAIHIIVGSLLAVSLAQAQSSITVINQGFELPGTVKTTYWSGGAIVPGIIPGWTPSGVGVEGGGGDSGVEALGPQSGLWRGFLAGPDPSIFQTTGYTILGSEPGFSLTIAAHDNFTSDASFSQFFNSAVMNLSLYYFDGANRVSLGNQDFLLPGFTFADYTFNVTSIPGAAIGMPLGIEIDSVGDVRDLEGPVAHSWINLDDVRLGVVPEPATVTLLSIGAASLLIFRRRRA